MRRREAVVALFALFSAAVVAQAPRPRQPPAPAAAISVTGRVIDEVTNEPIVNARVGSIVTEVGAAAVLTDVTGRFALSAPARSFLRVSKTGYGAQTISALSDLVDVRLQRSSAVGGRVVDENGEPVSGARVSLEPFPIPDRPGQFLQDTSTDDRGEFRLGGFVAGSYAVSLLVRGEQTTVTRSGPDGRTQLISQPSTTRLFYSGATDYREAKEIRLAAGEEITTIDFLVGAAQAAVQTFSTVSIVGINPEPAQERQGRSVVRGRVLSEDGQPLARAQVRLTDREFLRSQLVWTDNVGRFEFTGLPAGPVRLMASKAGFFPSVDNGMNPLGTVLELTEAEVHDPMEIRLVPWSVIAGRVLDEHGEPMSNAAVQTLQVQYVAGRRALVGAGATQTTNDRGEYRLYGIRPGQYIVSASIGQVFTGDVPGYARSYYPGTVDTAGAQYVTVGPGQATSAIDIALARVTTARVSGRMIDSRGLPTMGGAVQLVPSRSSALALSVGARIDQDGRFEFPNVSPGSYVIQVSRGTLNRFTEGEFAAVPVTVTNTDITDITVQTGRGTHVTGHVVFNGSTAAVVDASALEIRPIASNPDLSPNQAATARVLKDWTFELDGINGPRRLQVPRTPRGWALEAVRIGDVDVTDRPLVFGSATPTLDDVEITLTDRVSTVQATVVDAASKPSARLVVVFSTDRNDWYPESRFVRAARSTSTGPALLEGLPPGVYYAAALEGSMSSASGEWQDPSYLESLIPRASTITVNPAATTAVRLRF